MNTLVSDPLATAVSFKRDSFTVALADGRQLTVPLAKFPRLLQASKEQRADYVITGGGVGLHWDAIDEDISVKGLLLGVFDRSRLSA